MNSERFLTNRQSQARGWKTSYTGEARERAVVGCTLGLETWSDVQALGGLQAGAPARVAARRRSSAGANREATRLHHHH